MACRWGTLADLHPKCVLRSPGRVASPGIRALSFIFAKLPWSSLPFKADDYDLFQVWLCYPFTFIVVEIP